MADSKIEEILGFNTAKSRDSENVVRRFYVSADTPEKAKSAFERFADGLAVPDGLELSSVDLDEEKNGSGVYFGTITFTSPNPKIKNELSPSLSEVFGEKRVQGRKSETFERTFRIKADTAAAAKTILQNAAMPNDGRLHVSDISVDEETDGSGFFTGKVIYSNPDVKAPAPLNAGIVSAYGDRCTETFQNGFFNAGSLEMQYELRGFNNAYQALQSLKGQVGGGQNPYVTEISVDEDSGGADRVYTGRVRSSEEKEESDTLRSVSFEVSGSQTKMTHSLMTRGSWAADGKTPRNYGGLIGVTDDGVEGVDIDTAVSTFSETVFFYPWFLTTSYIAFLARAYGCVNNAPFRGFAAGEVRFLGTSGSYRQNDKAAELTFKFAVSPNAQNLRVGSMTIPFKYGWDYLWVRWADKKENNVAVKVPVEAYIEQVYPGLNFYTLGIG